MAQKIQFYWENSTLRNICHGWKKILPSDQSLRLVENKYRTCTATEAIVN